MIGAIRIRVTMVVFALTAAGCGAQTFVPPPDTAGPAIVLTAYLERLVAGECADGKALATSTFVVGNGDLCGAARVRAYRIAPGDPATPSIDEVVFATTLTTDGSADGSVQRGDITWFYTLKRQSNGAWRLAGGGSGP